MFKDDVISKIREGIPTDKIAREFHVSNEQVSSIKRELGWPSSKIISKCNNWNGFKEYFIETYTKCSSTKEFLKIIEKHDLFKNISSKSLEKRVNEIRRFYELEPKMPERTYQNDHDRIRGYIIRNTKFMAKRRGIYFDLDYQDFDIPEYCPILGIKLTYMNESDGNDPSHASMDRIDNSKGYIKGNVIIISRLANSMKNQASFEQLKSFCSNMTKLINHYETQGALGDITDVFKDFTPKLSLDL